MAKNYRILVINDELEVLRVIEEFLSKQGFSILIVSGSEKAQEVLGSEEKIDLIVLDLKMPKMSGVKLLEKIRESKPNIPVIILTGSLYVERYKEDLERLNCKDILFKPLDLNLLLEKIKEKLP